MQPEITIIVVNWNSGLLTRTALDPYIHYKGAAFTIKIVVVDNASTDNSISILTALPVQLIVNDTNRGFGHACNQAFELAGNANYLLLLNPDTKSDPAVLKTLVDFLEKQPRYAVAGPKQVDENGKILRCCGRFPGFFTALYEVLGLSKVFPQIFTPAPLMTDWNHLESRQVDHIMGSYMLIKKKAIETTGFMDEDFFVYAEDLDLSRRLANAGFKSYYNSDVSIFHAGGGSGDKVAVNRLYYSLSARRIYWKKHLSRTGAAILVLLSFCAEPFIRILKSPGSAGTILKAYQLYYQNRKAVTRIT